MGIVCVFNGEIQSTTFASLQAFCMECPRGAYTTAYVKNDYAVVDWEIHVKRLIKSIAAVHAKLDACFAAHYAALAELPSGSEASVLQAAVLPSLLSALTAAAAAAQGVSKIVTIIVIPGINTSPLDVRVAVAVEQQTLQQTSQQGSFATVLGPPRQIPIGKDSGWVAQRQFLESMRPPGASEVLLCTEDGKLLEGLVTNLYVLGPMSSKNSNPPRSGGGSIVDGNGVMLQTAGMEDGVVWGTMRQRVLCACEALGLPVVEVPPDSAERASWKEAFLTNALRRVEPLGRLECGERNVWGLEPWKVEFGEVPGPWTARIQAHVEASMEATDVRTLPGAGSSSSRLS